MDSENAVLQDFLKNGLSYIDAIIRLESIGYNAKDAERIVSEWAEDAECQCDGGQS